MNEQNDPGAVVAPTYPAFSCATCVASIGREWRKDKVGTWHFSECDICGQFVAVTSPHTFGGFTDAELAEMRSRRCD